MLARANLIHVAIVSLVWDSIELITPTHPRRSLVPSILHKLSVILLTTFSMDARSRRSWSIRLIRRQSGSQPRAALAAAARMRWGRYPLWRRAEFIDRRMELRQVLLSRSWL